MPYIKMLSITIIIVGGPQTGPTWGADAIHQDAEEEEEIKIKRYRKSKNQIKTWLTDAIHQDAAEEEE